METENSVRDEKRKLTAEELGKLQVKTNEIVRRIEAGTISYESALGVMQKIIIEGQSEKHLDVISENASITYLKHVIDCEAEPYIPPGLTVEVHLKHGFIEFYSANISLYLSNEQKNGRIVGFYLRNEILYKPLMNANVLDYLLANPKLIPQDWRNKCVFFWGTIYKADGCFYVRGLYYSGSKWDWICRGLKRGFSSTEPVAIVG